MKRNERWDTEAVGGYIKKAGGLEDEKGMR